MKDVEKLIDSRFHYLLKSTYKVVEVPAKDLITSERLDIAIKFRYAKHLIENNSDIYSLTLYREHLKVISNNTYIEPGDQNKSGIDDYIAAFKALISSVKNNGFEASNSLIPLGDNNVPLDGAHRIAIAAALNLNVNCLRFNIPGQIYDTYFFKSRFTNDNLLNEFFLEYVKSTNEQLSVVIEWPLNLNLSNDIFNVYNDHIVHSLNLDLDYKGVKNLMLMNYWGEPWLQGDKFNNIGVHSKVKECFKGGVTKFYWVKNLSLKERINLKEKVRSLIHGTKHSLHSTDSKEECLNLSCSLLDFSSSKLLNHIDPDFSSEYITKLRDLNIKGPQFLVSGSGTLGIIGLRKPRDIDTFYDGEATGDILGSHNKYMHFLDVNDRSFIYDPSFYFYYFGFKFLNKDKLILFKLNRGEAKDKKDVESLELFHSGGNKRSIKFLYYSVLQLTMFTLINLIKKMGLKSFVKKVLGKK
ncbi:conserved hypothetical protein [Vibrio chagasii]|nr:conserved hypothetical protein [Vibrio chagasii]